MSKYIPYDERSCALTEYHEERSPAKVFQQVRSFDVPPEPEHWTIGRRWKHRRNIVIVAAHEIGISQRFLADVFDMPHSRIAAIVKEYRGKFGSSENA